MDHYEGADADDDQREKCGHYEVVRIALDDLTQSDLPVQVSGSFYATAAGALYRNQDSR
jgi:hypothetical protein